MEFAVTRERLSIINRGEGGLNRKNYDMMMNRVSRSGGASDDYRGMMGLYKAYGPTGETS
jgi:hypothetical protein